MKNSTTYQQQSSSEESYRQPGESKATGSKNRAMDMQPNKDHLVDSKVLCELITRLGGWALGRRGLKVFLTWQKEEGVAGFQVHWSLET